MRLDLLKNCVISRFFVLVRKRIRKENFSVKLKEGCSCPNTLGGLTVRHL